MHVGRIGQIVFAAVIVPALALYALTTPDGLPWNDSTHLALAYLGETIRLPEMRHPVWGFYVQVFGGAVALSSFLAALAAGLLAVIVCRYVGWRFAVSAAVAWIFLPGIWNGAITGERSVCFVSMIVAVVWLLDSLRRCVRGGMHTDEDEDEEIDVSGRKESRRIAERVAMSVALVFAVVSLVLHDYRLGEPAAAYARGVAEAADERIVILNGICDDQVVRETARSFERRNSSRSSVGRGDGRAKGRRQRPSEFRVLFLSNDEIYRTKLVTWVRSAFPAETDLLAAAQVGGVAFAEAAARKYPERFYQMNGKSASVEQWERRWKAFAPYLESDDPFVRVAGRVFGCEGNGIGNGLLEGRGISNRESLEAAYALYRRIYDEIDPGNVSALINMGDVIRHGHAVSADEKNQVREALSKFSRDIRNRSRLREIIRSQGPVRIVPSQTERTVEEKRDVIAGVVTGETTEIDPESLSLVEWKDMMCRLADKGELVQAGRIARTILSNPKWRECSLANAVMGSVVASEGDDVASEWFFRTALGTTNRISAVAMKDFADTLVRLGKTEEAERMLRRSARKTDEGFVR